MALIISTVDIPIRIRPNFKHLTRKEPFQADLKAGQPTELPDHIAAYFVQNRPHVYRYANQPPPEKKIGGELTKTGLPKGQFDPLEFVEENAENIEEAVNGLDNRQQILAIAKLLKIKGTNRQKTVRIKERILTDIKAKKGALKNVEEDEE